MGGTIYQAVMQRAAHLPLLQSYLNGTISQSDFCQQLDLSRPQLKTLGLSDWWIDLLARFPSDVWHGARRLADALREYGITTSANAVAPGDGAVDPTGFAAFEQLVSASFSHLPDRYTSIFPEESRSAYTLSCAIRPTTIFVAGSYYGYLAVWLLPGLAPDGQIVCSDVDPLVCDLARRNFTALGENDRVNVICEDAERLLKQDSRPIDLFVLDAYGSHQGPDPRYHGKAIYGPLLQAALPRLHENSLLLVHNAERDSADLAEFFQVLGQARLSLELKTTDNLAVYQR